MQRLNQGHLKGFKNLKANQKKGYTMKNLAIVFLLLSSAACKITTTSMDNESYQGPGLETGNYECHETVEGLDVFAQYGYSYDGNTNTTVEQLNCQVYRGTELLNVDSSSIGLCQMSANSEHVSVTVANGTATYRHRDADFNEIGGYLSCERIQ